MSGEKENHPEHKYSVTFFERRNNKKTYLTFLILMFIGFVGFFTSATYKETKNLDDRSVNRLLIIRKRPDYTSKQKNTYFVHQSIK